ncbi:MAG: PAS domain-containing protein [Thalassobaculum sp.]|uniref:PAS domain-containing protein n=1 Tax=Thalassobaculum sp. TaxID=2022740 RepID=UPI0032ED67C6
MSDDLSPANDDLPVDPRLAVSEPEGLLLAEACPEAHPCLDPVRPLVARWRRARSGDPGRLPPRDAFSPETLGGLLGRISLLEPVDGGRDFRFRIHAGIAADVGGIELGGKLVGEMPYPAYREAIVALFAAALEAEEPRFGRMRINWFGTIYDYVDLALPLLDRTRDVPMVLSVMLHYDVTRPTYVSRFRPAAMDRDTIKPVAD